MESKGLADSCRREMAEWVREHAGEIGDDIAERLGLLEKEPRAVNGWHADGVRKVIGPTLEYMCRAIEGKEDRQPPPEVITNARKLAGEGFPAPTLLRRYRAAESVFREHLRQAASSVKSRSGDGFAPADRAINGVFEGLLEVIEKEHAKEDQWLKSPRQARELKQIKQLLSGELIYPPDLGYDFSATHIGVVGSGPGVENEIGRLTKTLGGQRLIVQASPSQVWAWIGLKRPESAERLDDALKAKWKPTVRMGIGEPAADISGWRRTHHEAEAAFHVASRLGQATSRYRAVSLHAAILSNDLLKSFLEDNFLTPIARGRDDGQVLRCALRAYFAADRNRTSAAITLGISRQMLSKYLRQAEERIGQPLAHCASELEAALILDLMNEDVK